MCGAGICNWFFWGFFEVSSESHKTAKSAARRPTRPTGAVTLHRWFYVCCGALKTPIVQAGPAQIAVSSFSGKNEKTQRLLAGGVAARFGQRGAPRSPGAVRMTGGVSQARALAALDRTGWAVPPSDCTVRGLQAAGTPGCLGTRAVAHVARERPPRERACGVALWPGGLPQACSLGPQGAEAGGAGGTAPGAGFQSHPGDTVPEAGWPFLRAHGGLARIRPLRPGEHGRSRPAGPHFARAPSAAQAVGPSSPAPASSSRAAAAADGGRRRLCGH